MVCLFYTTYSSVDLTHHEIFYAKVGKGSKIGRLVAFIEQTVLLMMHYNMPATLFIETGK